MLRKVIIILFILVSSDAFAWEYWKYTLSDQKLKGFQLLSFDSFNNEKFIMLRTNSGKEFFLETIENGELKSEKLNEFSTLLGNAWVNSKFKFDPQGNIWFSLDRMWKYSNGNLQTFDIFRDIDTNWRKVIDFEFDNNGNMWIATAYFREISRNSKGTDFIGIYYQELFKYNSNGLERVKFDSIGEWGNYKFFGYQSMDRADNGTIFLSIKREKDNLMIFKDGEIKYRTLEGIFPSPERNVTDFEIMNENDFYVTYSEFHYIDGEGFIPGGISHFKDGTWRHYDGNDGLPIHGYALPPGNPKYPANAYSVCKDKEGNHYFAMMEAIVKITKDNEIVIYDGLNITRDLKTPLFSVPEGSFTNSFKDYVGPYFTNIAKVNNKLYATVMYGILEIDESTLSVIDEKNNQLKVYPNPILDNLATIELPENEIIKSISLIDLSGIKTNAEYELSSSKIELDCSNLSNGTYIVLTRTNAKSYYSKLIVKRK